MNMIQYYAFRSEEKMKTYVILDLPMDNYPLLQILASEHKENDQKIAFLFLQNSVMIFRNDRFAETYNLLLENNIEIYASESDVSARGIELEDRNIKLLDYDKIIDLIMDKSDKVFNL